MRVYKRLKGNVVPCEMYWMIYKQHNIDIHDEYHILTILTSDHSIGYKHTHCVLLLWLILCVFVLLKIFASQPKFQLEQ
jgi:ABC-type uncharacterized transport system permease subunit